MYNEIRLEKGMYHLAGKSFLQALEDADPSSQYTGTPLSRLDAYERQLKRFDIRVSGANCDRVEKFFTTTESAVLFPEFIRRAVVQGMEEAILSELTAAVTYCSSNRYQGIELTETAAYSTTGQGAELPVSSIQESTSTVSLAKYGRQVRASYEAVRQQKLDLFALMLRRVGKELAASTVSAALLVLKNGAPARTISGESLTYADLAALYGRFYSFEMKAVLASPAVVAQILAFDQMLEASSENVREIRLPFGSKLITCPQLDNDCVMGVDTDYALEQIRSSDVILETDKLINCQLDCIAISINMGFRKLMENAVKVVTLS